MQTGVYNIYDKQIKINIVFYYNIKQHNIRTTPRGTEFI